VPALRRAPGARSLSAVFDGHLMVAQADVMPALLRACPSFATSWAQYRADPAHVEGEHYLDVAEFARHVVERVVAGDASAMPEVFRAVEGLYRDGDGEVESLLTVGLLEGIQNLALGRSMDLNGFEQWLPPRVALEWKKVVDFWNGEAAGAER